VSDQGGDDGMVGPFPRSQGIGVLGVQAEVVAPVLQGETPSPGHNARAKPHVIAVDEGTGVALTVHYGQIDGVRGGQGGSPLHI